MQYLKTIRQLHANIKSYATRKYLIYKWLVIIVFETIIEDIKGNLKR